MSKNFETLGLFPVPVIKIKFKDHYKYNFPEIEKKDQKPEEWWESVHTTFNNISDWVKNLIEGLKPPATVPSAGAAGGVGNPTNERGTGVKEKGGKVEGGQRDFGDDYKSEEEKAFREAEEYKEDKKSNLNLNDSSVNSMDNTLKNKDLVKTGENVKKKGKEMVRYKYGGSTSTVEKGGYLDSLSKDELADKYAELYKRYLKDPDSFSKNELNDMLKLGSSAIAELIEKQKEEVSVRPLNDFEKFVIVGMAMYIGVAILF